MRKEVSLEERQKIKNSLKATHERRKTQIMKVFELKVNCHHTSKETFKKMDDYFVQSKWVYNDMLRTSENGENIFKYEYNHHKEITRLDKDKNEIKETVTLPCVYHRGIVNYAPP